MQGNGVERMEGALSANAFRERFVRPNKPVLLVGGASAWPAVRTWQEDSHLCQLAGDIPVEVMASTSTYFRGALGEHRRRVVSFGEFLGSEDPETCDYTPSCSEAATDNLYLAQVPLYKPGGGTKPALHVLMGEVTCPELFDMEALSAVNLWMNRGRTRSSVHYDPFHNLLCVVTGRKRVKLWSAQLTAALYPKALWGEASNHSAVDCTAPDLQLHPRFKEAAKSGWEVELQAGDQLFIPEGWWHQVDSTHRTAAVNFWWESDFTANLGGHMDTYYARRLLSSLLAEEKSRQVKAVAPCAALQATTTPPPSPKRPRLPTSSLSEELTAVEVSALRILAAAAAHAVQYDGAGEVANNADAKTRSRHEGDAREGDGSTLRPANVLATLPARSLRRVLYVMAVRTPRTLQAFVTHALSPLAAEIMITKFEESLPPPIGSSQADPLAAAEVDELFYAAFYGAFPQPETALAALVQHKETFARSTLHTLLTASLGLAAAVDSTGKDP